MTPARPAHKQRHGAPASHEPGALLTRAVFSGRPMRIVATTRLLELALLLFWLLGGTSAISTELMTGTCPEGWIPSNANSCVSLRRSSATYEACLATCAATQASVVSIHNFGDLLVMRQLAGIDMPSKHVWVRHLSIDPAAEKYRREGRDEVCRAFRSVIDPDSFPQICRAEESQTPISTRSTDSIHPDDGSWPREEGWLLNLRTGSTRKSEQGWRRMGGRFAAAKTSSFDYGTRGNALTLRT